MISVEVWDRPVVDERSLQSVVETVAKHLCRMITPGAKLTASWNPREQVVLDATQKPLQGVYQVDGQERLRFTVTEEALALYR